MTPVIPFSSPSVPARRSMPGMMETILNVGLNEETLKGVIQQSGNERFAWDSYRRLIQMYSDVVMEKAEVSSLQKVRIRSQLERELIVKKQKAII